MSGHLEEPDRNAEELLYAKWVEPVAGALGGFILLKLNPSHHLLNIAVRNMSNSFGGLSDSHVLNSAWAEGLGHLIKGLERVPFDHPQFSNFRRIWEKRVPGLIWTAVPLEDL